MPRIAIAAAGARIESSFGPVENISDPGSSSSVKMKPFRRYDGTRTDSEDITMEIMHPRQRAGRGFRASEDGVLAVVVELVCRQRRPVREIFVVLLNVSARVFSEEAQQRGEGKGE